MHRPGLFVPAGRRGLHPRLLMLVVTQRCFGHSRLLAVRGGGVSRLLVRWA
jgi:hypothetical protein